MELSLELRLKRIEQELKGIRLSQRISREGSIEAENDLNMRLDHQQQEIDSHRVKIQELIDSQDLSVDKVLEQQKKERYQAESSAIKRLIEEAESNE